VYFAEKQRGTVMKRTMKIIGPLTVLSLGLLVGCTSNIRETAPGEDPSVALEEARDDVRAVANNTLQMLYARQPQVRQLLEGAAGYAVFSNFGMKILFAGGGTGRGLAVNNATRQETFMRMAEVQAGLGFGAKKFRLVWIFETQDAFNNFINKGYQIGGQATLTARASGKGAGYAGAVSVSPGVWVYQITDDGIAAELTVKGTNYYRDKKLN
jgi:lipid-binding SYLF domain-containing protein